MSRNIQVNISMPTDWREAIDKAARERSVKENRTIPYQDLIREALKEYFKFKDGKK